MINLSSPKIRDDAQEIHISLRHHLFKAFVISFSVTLSIQLLLLILFIALGQYANAPQKFGIGIGSFEIIRHSDITYNIGSGMFIIAITTGLLNTLIHYFRKHALK